MKVLVLGASGATGKLLVRQLLKRQIAVRLLVREATILEDDISANTLVEVIRGNISELSDPQISQLLQNCSSVVSCLGHNISFKGLLGKPRNLVSNALARLVETAKKSQGQKFKFMLMSTTGYTNPLLKESNSVAEKIVLSLLYLLLPPHRDNVRAGSYLLNTLADKEKNIEWVAVRPDSLISDTEESPYQVCQSPLKSPLFNAGKSSRINVSHFMAQLLTDELLWQEWSYKTPVLYNSTQL